ncbi:TPA: type 1 fimbrial protein [Salmonella enterica]|uniref:Type 1 fimbrial protein n=1 Tax=Salmonella enterica TaxID=28901 RepID=A0A758AKG0_SALER|nr:type 1 fimbrial protein [Salmonella enterica]
MIRKTLIAAATFAAAMSSASVFAEGGSVSASPTPTGKFGGGTITFTGSVTEAPCSIPAGEANQNIDLGTVSNKVLASSGAGSTPVAVKINLKNCDLSTSSGSTKYNKASLKFLNDGKLDSTDLSKGFLQTTGPVNVGVQLLDRTMAGINFTSDDTMKPATEVALTTGADSTITFWARLKGKAGASTAPAAGSVTAQVSYQLDYH